MIVMRDGERLYPASWEYNSCRILSRLAILIENAGGNVKPLKKAVVSNRSGLDKIYKLQESIENWKQFTEKKPEYKETAQKAIKNAEKEIEELQQAEQEPITVTHTSYLIATLDGKYIHISFDSNPFFEFYLMKTPIRENGSYSRDAAMEEIKKDWLWDCFITGSAAEEDVKEAAAQILNIIQAAKDSPIIRDGRRQRVRNVYNDGYHYETVYAPERIGKIDW